MRVSAAILALAGGLTPLAAAGVELGDIEHDSYIDKPFQGRIELLDVDRDGLDDITARLAPAAEFRNAGMERTPTVRALDFEPVWENGRAFLRITTSRPVTRSFLDFLVELEWPAGRQLRGYTVLLDPPDTTDEEPAAVEAPKARAETPSAGAADGALEYGRVQEGDKLWAIAEELRNRMGGDVSTEQVALALLRDNPEAFQNGNVNQLMAGYILRIDDSDSVDDMGANEAQTEFWRQYRAWQDFRQRRAEQASVRPENGAQGSMDSGSGGEAGADASDSGKAASSDGEEAGAVDGAEEGEAPSGLTLEGPEAISAGEAPGGGEDQTADDPRIQELRDELDTVLAEAEARREGNEALRERLAAMEEQLNSMERLLEFDSAEVAALQEGAKEEQDEVSSEWAIFRDLLDRHPQWVGLAGGLFILLLALVWVAARRHTGSRSEPENKPRQHRSAAVEEKAGPSPEPAGSQDPMTEADIYFSMSRYAEAVEVLEKAIAHHPRHAEYRRRLAEIHHAHGNREAFLREARSMREELGDSAPMEWARVAALGATMAPDDPLFARQPEPESAPAPEEPAAEPTPAGEDEERIDASLEDEFADLMGEQDHRAEWDETVANETVSPLEPEGEATAEPAASAEAASTDDIPVVDLDLAEDWVEGSPEAAFAHAEAEPAAPESATESDEPVGEAAEEGPQVIDLAEPEATPESPTEGPAAPMDADELQSAYDDLMADEGTAPEPEPEPEMQPEDTSEKAQDAGEAPEGLHPLEADESAAWDEFEDDVADLLNDVDEIGTKLDLARAYIDMGDAEGARSILEEVMEEGSEAQQQEARSLLDQDEG